MAKRAAFDLTALTAEPAVPMPKASPPSPAILPAAAAPANRPVPASVPPSGHARAEPSPAKPAIRPQPVPTASLEALQFKVSPAFSKRFRRAAFEHDLKLNELLFEAFAAWEAGRMN